MNLHRTRLCKESTKRELMHTSIDARIDELMAHQFLNSYCSTIVAYFTVTLS